MTNYDAIIIGAGPNGLAAAVELARSGRSVCVYEANPTIGGGARSAALTLPGFTHDVCSAVYPLAAGSPFFLQLPLHKYGLEFVYSPASLAHPFDDGTAVVIDRSVEVTSESLGRDRSAYQQLFSPIVERWHEIAADFLGPIRFPRHPLTAASGQHILRAYCHVPNGSPVDMTNRIENQIERFAPGFSDCILERSVMTPADLEFHNANLVGGDINGGFQGLSQMFLRPTFRLYATPAKGLYICSSSTPPGGGVHGMCGYHAARVALRKSLR